MHRTALLLTFTILSFTSYGNNRPTEDYRTDNLIAFSRLFGYVRYFYPSDAGVSLDWDKFALYGIKQVADCRTTGELEQELKSLFFPIAPSLVIERVAEQGEPIIRKLSPDTTYTFWQHQGVGLGVEEQADTYQSKRVHLRRGALADSLFDQVPDTFTVTKSLGRGLSCRFPLILSLESARGSSASRDSLVALTDALPAYSFDLRD